LPQVWKDIAGAIKSGPVKYMNIVCYHYETRHYKDSKGNSRTKRVRVTTHTASKDFDCTSFVDQSPPVGVLYYLDMLKVTRLHTTKIINMTPVARERFDKERDAFFKANKRDKYQKMSYPEDIPG
jgi:hypothetical protein